MNHALCMGVLEGFGDPGNQFRGAARVIPAGLHPRFQSLALDEFCHEIANAVARLADFMKGNDTLMLELRDASRFAQEAAGFLFRGQAPGPLYFDGHGSVQLGVPRPKDIAERSCAKLGLQLEFSEATIPCREL